MADDTVDALVLTARFDEQSLDASAQAQLAAVRRFITTIGELGQTVPAFRLAVDTTQLTTAQAAIADLTTGIREAAGQPIPVVMDIAPLQRSAEQAVEQLAGLRADAEQVFAALPPLVVDTGTAQTDVRAVITTITALREELATAGATRLQINTADAVIQVERVTSALKAIPVFRVTADISQLATARTAIDSLLASVGGAGPAAIPLTIDVAPLERSAQQAIEQLATLRTTAAQILTGLPPLAVNTAAAQAQIIAILAQIESVRTNLAAAGSAGLSLNVSQANAQIGALESELATLVEQLSGQIELNLDLAPFRASLEQGTAQLDAFRATAEQALAGLPPFQIDIATAQADIRSLIDTIDVLRNQLAEAGSAGLRIDTEQAVAQITRIGDLIRDIPAFRITADASEVVSAQKIIAELSATVSGAARAGIPVTLDLTLLRQSVADGIALLASLRAGAVRSLSAIPGLKIDTTVAQTALASVGTALGLLREQLNRRSVVQVDIGQAQAEIARIQALLGELPVLRVTADTTQLLAAQEVLDRFLGTASKQGAVLAPLTWDISPFNAAVDEVLRRLDQIGQAAQSLGGAENIAAPVIAPVPPEALGSIERLEAQMGRTADATEALAGFFAGLVTEIVRLAGTADTAGGAFDRLGVSERAAGQAVPVGQFAAFAQEIAAAQARLGTLPGTLDRVAAGMGKGTAGALAMAVGMERLAVQMRATTAAAEQTARRTEQFAEASRQANLGPFAKGLENIRLSGAGARAELERTAPALEAHARGAHQAANALSILAAESIGVTGPIGRLAENLLLFSGGFGVVAVVAGAVLALAKAFEFLTGRQREAQEKQDAYVKGLQQEADNAIPAAIRATEALTAALEAQRKAREGLTAAKVLRVEGEVLSAIADPQAAIISARIELQRRADKEAKDGARLVAQARKDVSATEINDLAAALNLHIATSVQRARAVELVRVLQGLQGGLLQTEENRLTNARTLNALQDALSDKLREQAILNLQNQAITGTNTAQQQALRGEDAALVAHFNLQKAITTQGTAEQQAILAAFYIQRRALAVRAAQADEQAIRAKIANLRAQPEPTGPNADKELLDRATLISGFQQEITLRRDALGIQLQQLSTTERQTAAEALNVAQLIAAQRAARILAAGGGNQLGGAPPVRVEIIQPTTAPTGAGALPAILQGIQQSGVTRDLEAGLQRDAQAAQRLNAELRNTTQGISTIINTFAGLTRSQTLIDGTVQRVGLIGEAAAHSLQDILGLVGGLGQLRQAAASKAAAATIADPAQQAAALANASIEKFAGVVGVVSAGLNIVGSLLSIGAALDAEHNNLFVENNRRIAELNLRLDRSFQGATGIQKAAGLTGSVATAVSQVTNAEALGFLKTREAFTQAVEATGLSISEFDKLIRDATGIEILDSRGHVVAHTLEQANAAFQLVIQSVTHFGTAISDQQRVLETRDNLGLGPNAGQPQELASLSRTREIELQGLQLDPATEAKIAALDLTTEAGRKAFLAFNQMLFTLAQNGQLTAEQLGEFASVTELLGPLNDAANGIRALSDATNDATAAMINVPAGFKQAALAFEAQIPGLGPNAPKLPTLTPTHFEPQPAFSVTTQTGTPKTGATTATISVGQITIQIDAAGKNGFQLAQEIKGHLRDLSNADSGDPDSWGQT